MAGPDAAMMARALRLAARGRGRVEPNPMVGCVLVRSGRIIGEGYHARFGGPHAEVNALRRARESARGCDVYVTLEPCCHFGKTPPCTEALIRAGVRRVFAAMPDPGPFVSGRGLRRLREAGIEVHLGLLREHAEQLNAPYLTLLREGRPWTILKWAASADGKIATRTGRSRWITGPQARRLVHRWRGLVDAVVVGVGTVVADDPLLTARLVQPRRTATRVVLDPNLRVPVEAAVVRTARGVPTLIATTHGALRRRAAHARRLEERGCALVACREGRGGLSLRDLWRRFGRGGWTNVLVEAGSRVNGSLLSAGLVDEVRWFVAPLLIGGEQAPGPIGGAGFADLRGCPRLEGVSVRRVGRDVLCEAVVARQRRTRGRAGQKHRQARRAR